MENLHYDTDFCILYSTVLVSLYKCSAVAEMGNRLATIDMGQKLGTVPLLGELGPHVTVWHGPSPTFLPSGIFVYPAVWPQQTWAKNWGRATFLGGWVPVEHSVVWVRHIFIPSDILIHPAIWPQCTWAENWGAVPPFLGRELGPHLAQYGLGQGLPCIKYRLYPSSRLAIDMGQKLGAVSPFFGRGAVSPSSTIWPVPRPTPYTKWYLDPSSHLATTDMG